MGLWRVFPEIGLIPLLGTLSGAHPCPPTSWTILPRQPRAPKAWTDGCGSERLHGPQESFQSGEPSVGRHRGFIPSRKAREKFLERKPSREVSLGPCCDLGESDGKEQARRQTLSNVTNYPCPENTWRHSSTISLESNDAFSSCPA